MNQFSLYFLFSLLAMGFVACGETEPETEAATATTVEAEAPAVAATPVAFTDEITEQVFTHYLALQSALFDSDLTAARDASQKVVESFGSSRPELKSLAQQMADADDIEVLRAHFYQFSQEVEPLFKSGLTDGTIYKQYCPMAFDDQGAYWFAAEKEINNPYFGARMAHCGKVQEVIQ